MKCLAKICGPLTAAVIFIFIAALTGPTLYHHAKAALLHQQKEAQTTKSYVHKASQPSVVQDHVQAVSKPSSPSTTVIDDDHAEAAPVRTIKPAPVARNAPLPGKQTPVKKQHATRDLSAYDVEGRSAHKNDYLPADKSLLAHQLIVEDDEEDGWTGGGFVNQVIKTAKRTVDNIDRVTLNTTRSVLGSMASPDKARIRPTDDGVNLHIEIPVGRGSR